MKPQSAKFPGKESFSGSIPATHMGMTKFSSKHDPGFKRVSGRLEMWVKKLFSESKTSGEGETRPGKQSVAPSGHQADHKN